MMRAAAAQDSLERISYNADEPWPGFDRQIMKPDPRPLWTPGEAVSAEVSELFEFVVAKTPAEMRAEYSPEALHEPAAACLAGYPRAHQWEGFRHKVRQLMALKRDVSISSPAQKAYDELLEGLGYPEETARRMALIMEAELLPGVRSLQRRAVARMIGVLTNIDRRSDVFGDVAGRVLRGVDQRHGKTTSEEAARRRRLIRGLGYTVVPSR